LIEPSIQGQNAFAEMPAVLHFRVSVPDGFDGINPVDERLDPAVRKKRQYIFSKRLGDGGLFLERAGADDRTDNLLALNQQLPQVHLGRGSAEKPDDRQPAADGQHLYIRLHIVGTDMIEDDVRATVHGKGVRFGREILCPVVDNPIADLPVFDVSAERVHATRHLQTENVRLAGRRGIVSLTRDDVGPVNRRGQNAGTHLVRPG
jgi:hypothetical protein